MANAAIAAGAELIICSSLPNVTKMTGREITVYKQVCPFRCANAKNPSLSFDPMELSAYVQFDSKAAVETYIRGLPIKSAFFLPAMYMQMMTNVFRPKMVRTFPRNMNLHLTASRTMTEIFYSL